MSADNPKSAVSKPFKAGSYFPIATAMQFKCIIIRTARQKTKPKSNHRRWGISPRPEEIVNHNYSVNVMLCQELKNVNYEGFGVYKTEKM